MEHLEKNTTPFGLLSKEEQNYPRNAVTRKEKTMSDVMLHGVLNMPLPDDPAECDFMTWMQLKQRARQASAHIHELEEKLAAKEKLMLALAGDKIDLVSELAGVKGKLSKSEALLAKAVGCLENIASNTCCDRCQEAALWANATLTELSKERSDEKGQDDAT